MAGEALTVDIEVRNGIQWVHVTGSWDNLTHGQIKDHLDPLVDQPPVRIVLDCEKLTYINSTGLILLARYERVTSQPRSFFGIAALNRRITRAIEMLGMDKKMKLFSTVEEAAQAAASL